MNAFRLLAAPIVCLGVAGASVGSEYFAPPAGRAGVQPPDAARMERPMLTVSGMGFVSVKPDRASVRLGAVAQKPEAAAAQAEVSRIMQAAIESIKKLGVPESAITTSGLSLFAVFDQRPRMQEAPGEPRIVGYRAGNTITVQLDDLTKVGAVIDEGIRAGANQLESLSFELRDDAEQRRESLRRAVLDARAKADAIAAALDLPIDGVLEVVEEGVAPVVPVFRGAHMEAAMSMGDGGTPVEPGHVRVQAGVVIRYRLGTARR